MQLAFAGRYKTYRILGWIAAGALVLNGCASATQTHLFGGESKEKHEYNVGSTVVADFETHLRFRQESTVVAYLQRLASSLMGYVSRPVVIVPNPSATTAAPAVTDGPDLLPSVLPSVHLVQRDDPRWKNFSLPGNRIYLCVGLVKHLEFENELAAAIALEWGHLIYHHPEKRIEQIRAEQAGPLAFFGWTGVFSYTEEMETASTIEATNILYRAGYDPRGVLSLLETYRDHPAKSPYEDAILEKMIETARVAIAQNAPLRNPIIRSQAFLEIHKRIQRL